MFPRAVIDRAEQNSEQLAAACFVKTQHKPRAERRESRADRLRGKYFFGQKYHFLRVTKMYYFYWELKSRNQFSSSEIIQYVNFFWFNIMWKKAWKLLKQKKREGGKSPEFY